MNTLVITNQTAIRMAVISALTKSELFAGAKALMIEQLKEKLRVGMVHFVYVKRDGSLREAWGTTNASLASKYTNGRGCSREAFATTAYFDVEVGAWRSFRWENIVKVY